MTQNKHTQGPVVVHGGNYPLGVKGDVYAMDGKDIRSATPICRVVRPRSLVWFADPKNKEVDSLATTAHRNQEKPIIEANAAFIAEAFNVAHETGKTPRQLADENGTLSFNNAQAALAICTYKANIASLEAQNKELLAALKRVSSGEGFTGSFFANQNKEWRELLAIKDYAKAAIAKAEGGAK